MLALVKRVKNLEKEATDRSQTGRLDGMVVYQPNAEELADAMAILVECGAVREDRVRLLQSFVAPHKPVKVRSPRLVL